MTVLGRGATATILELSPDRVAKVFHGGFPLAAVEYERQLLRTVTTLNLPLARYLDFTTIEGRPALVLERVYGAPLFDEVRRHPLSLSRYLDLFIAAQRAIHSHRCPDLPAQAQRFAAQIRRGDLAEETLTAVLALVGDLPAGEQVCHGDFHAGNVMATGKGLVTLDWMNAYRGHPVGDLARSYLMLKSPFNPLPIRGLRKWLFLGAKAVVAEVYRRRSLAGHRVPRSQWRRWLAAVAAVRLCDQVPDERAWLLAIIQSGLTMDRISSTN